MLSRRQLLLGGTGLSATGVLGYTVYKNSMSPESTEPDHGGDGSTPTRPESESNGSDPVEPTDERTTGSDVLNVRNFGAKGDGRTDDSAAIEGAIEAADPGETVLLPETEASYLLSFDGSGNEAAIELGRDTNLDGISVVGATPRENAQTLQVESGSYDPSTSNWIIRLDAEAVIDGFQLRNVTIDGARPENDGAAGLDGEASVTGILLRRGRANGGHDISIEDCLVRDCSATAFRFEESGVTCRYTTARRAGRHGFNPVAGDTTTDPGFVGEWIEAIDCDGTGVDHRRGTARLENLYTKNNRSGNKWKHLVEGLEVINHHSVKDRNRGWRSNQTGSPGEDPLPETQEIVLKRVFIEEPTNNGIRINGGDAPVECELVDIEVRGASTEGSRSNAGIQFLRDAETIVPSTGSLESDNSLVVVGTEGGEGVYVAGGATLDIGTYYHANNDGGAFDTSTGGRFRFERERTTDPGTNVFDTPDRSEVGAFARASPDES